MGMFVGIAISGSETEISSESDSDSKRARKPTNRKESLSTRANAKFRLRGCRCFHRSSLCSQFYVAIRRPSDTYATGTLVLDRKSTRLNSSHLVISYAV